jgi:hypothetical protein
MGFNDQACRWNRPEMQLAARCMLGGPQKVGEGFFDDTIGIGAAVMDQINDLFVYNPAKPQLVKKYDLSLIHEWISS